MVMTLREEGLSGISIGEDVALVTLIEQGVSWLNNGLLSRGVSPVNKLRYSLTLFRHGVDKVLLSDAWLPELPACNGWVCMGCSCHGWNKLAGIRGPFQTGGGTVECCCIMGITEKRTEPAGRYGSCPGPRRCWKKPKWCMLVKFFFLSESICDNCRLSNVD